MKKIISYLFSAVFAALMVYNIGAGNLLAKNTDVSLESIKIMAAAAQTELPEVTITCNAQPGFCWDGTCYHEFTPFGGWVYVMKDCYWTGSVNNFCSPGFPC